MGTTLPGPCSPEQTKERYERDKQRDKWSKLAIRYDKERKTKEKLMNKIEETTKQYEQLKDSQNVLKQQYEHELMQYKQALAQQTSQETIIGTNDNNVNESSIQQSAIKLQQQIQRQIAEHNEQIEANKALKEKNDNLQKQIDELKAALIEKPERRQSIFDKIDALQTKMQKPSTPSSPFNDIPIIDEKMIISALRQKISTLETKLDAMSDKNSEKIPTFTPAVEMSLTKADSISQSAGKRVFRTLSESNTLHEFMQKYQDLLANEDSVSANRLSTSSSTDSSDPDDSSYDAETDTYVDEVDMSMSVSKFMFADVQTESSVLRAVCMKKNIMKNQWGGSMSSMYINHPLPDDDEDGGIEESETEEVNGGLVIAKVPMSVANNNGCPKQRHSQLITKRSSEKWNFAEMKKAKEEMQNQLAHLVSSHVQSQNCKNYRFSVDDPKWFAIIKKLNKDIEDWSPTLQSVEYME